MGKPRILIIENSIAITGALKSILRSSQGLASEYTFIFILPKNSAATSYVRGMGFETLELPLREIRRSFFALLCYVPALVINSVRLRRIVRDLKIDLITVNDFYNLLPIGYKMLRGKTPYVCYVRFLPSKFPARLVKLWCSLHQRYANAIIAVSEAVKDELPYQQGVEVIGNELPSEEIQLRATPNATTILYPSNYIQGKGQEFALQSFALIFRSYPQWKLKFVGGDMGMQKNKDFKAFLIALANRLKFQNQVEWNDFSEKLSEEYLNAGIVLNFSESESFSMTCLEAMFYGRPIIATRSGGPSEIIDQNDTGILVDLKDVNAMSNAIEYLIKNPDKREAMGRRAYERVRQKYSFANTVQRLGEVYETILKDYRSETH